MQEYNDTLLEPFAVDGIAVPLLRLNDIDLPSVSVRVGDTDYMYERSVPIKGHGAILPAYLANLLSEGKKPLLVERIERYYVYLARDKAAAGAADAAKEPAAETPAAEAAPTS